MKKRFVSSFANFGSKSSSSSSTSASSGSGAGANATPNTTSSANSHGTHGPSSASATPKKENSTSGPTPGASSNVVSAAPSSARASRRYPWADRIREKLPPLAPNEYEVLWERGVLGVIFLESEKESIPYVSKATETCISTEISPGDTLKFVNVIRSKDHSFSDFFKILATMKKPVLLRFERGGSESAAAADAKKSKSSKEDLPTRLDHRALSAGSLNSDPSADSLQPPETKTRRSNSLSHQENPQNRIRNTFWRSKSSAMNAARASLNFKSSKPQPFRTPPLPPTIPEEGYMEYEVVWDHGSLGLIFAENKETALPIVSRTTSSNPIVQTKVMINDTLLSANNIPTSDFTFDAFFAQLQHLQKPVVLKFRRKNQKLTRSSVTPSPVSDPPVRCARSPSTPMTRSNPDSPMMRGKTSSSPQTPSPSVHRSPPRGPSDSPSIRASPVMSPHDPQQQHQDSSDDVGVGPSSPTPKHVSSSPGQVSRSLMGSRSWTGQRERHKSPTKPMSLLASAMSKELALAAASIGLARAKTVTAASEGADDEEIAARVDPKPSAASDLSAAHSASSQIDDETLVSNPDREFALPPPPPRSRKDSGSDKKFSEHNSLSPARRELRKDKCPALSALQTLQESKPYEAAAAESPSPPLDFSTPPQSPKPVQPKDLSGDSAQAEAVAKGMPGIYEDILTLQQPDDANHITSTSDARPTAMRSSLLETTRARARSRSRSRSSETLAEDPPTSEAQPSCDPDDSMPAPPQQEPPKEASSSTIRASSSPTRPPPPPPPVPAALEVAVATVSPTTEFALAKSPVSPNSKSSQKKRAQSELLNKTSTSIHATDSRNRRASAEQPQAQRVKSAPGITSLTRAKRLSTDGQLQSGSGPTNKSQPLNPKTSGDTGDVDENEMTLAEQAKDEKRKVDDREDLIPLGAPEDYVDDDQDDQDEQDGADEAKDKADDEVNEEEADEEVDVNEEGRALEEDEMDVELRTEELFSSMSSSDEKAQTLKAKQKRHDRHKPRPEDEDESDSSNKAAAVTETGMELSNDPLDSIDQDLDAMDGNEMMPGSSSKLKSESSSSPRSSRMGGTNNQAAQKYKRKSKGRAMAKLPIISEQEAQTIPLVAPKSVNTSVQVRGRAKPKLSKRNIPDSATYLIKWKETGGIGLQLREVRLAKGVYPLVTDVCQQPCCICLKHVCVGDIVVEINGRNTSTMGVKKTVSFIRSCNKTTLLKFRRGPAFVNERVSALV